MGSGSQKQIGNPLVLSKAVKKIDDGQRGIKTGPLDNNSFIKCNNFTETVK